eukprot:TRINITY_DN7307_c0_g1_i2.p1 TRINITY_DN7307_c0_g1~~TRINITY_DN7307_c0_g1_i2.p1  ORF type:complete len:916 (-),score=180.24 TRINITY_DN7307_c0_g1_i2:23-2770(-)
MRLSSSSPMGDVITFFSLFVVGFMLLHRVDVVHGISTSYIQENPLQYSFVATSSAQSAPNWPPPLVGIDPSALQVKQLLPCPRSSGSSSSTMSSMVNCTEFMEAHGLFTLPQGLVDVPQQAFLIYATNNSSDEGYLYLWSPCSVDRTPITPLSFAQLSVRIDSESFVTFDAASNLIIATPSAVGFYLCPTSEGIFASQPQLQTSLNCSFVSAATAFGGDSSIGKAVYDVIPTTAPGEVIVCSSAGLALAHLILGGSESPDVVEAFASMPRNASSIPCIAAAFTPGIDEEAMPMSIAFSPPADPDVEYGYVYMWRYVSFSLSDDTLQQPLVQLWNNYSVGGIISAQPTSMEFDDYGQLWVGSWLGCDIQTWPDLSWWRVNGYLGGSSDGGMPYGNVTSLVKGVSPGEMFIGTERGLIRFYSGDEGGDWNTYGPFYYYYGPRYHPGNSVSSLLVLSNPFGMSQVLFATETGLGFISFEEWTLSQKVALLETINNARHDRYGLTSECGLEAFGDLTTWYPKDSDNDGSNTAYYLIAESYRFATTQDPEAYELAWRTFETLEKLCNISGTKGYPSRSFIKYGTPIYGGGTWYNSTVYPGWQWKSDTSSDEVIFHFLAYPLFHDLVCQDDVACQTRAITLVDDIATYILDNNYYLIDPGTGKHTSWGVWNPDILNNGDGYMEERGLNSMEMLSFLIAAYRMTSNPRYLNAYNDLIETSLFGLNSVTEFISAPTDIDYADHDMSFLTRFALYDNLIKLKMPIPWWLDASLERAFAFLVREKRALFHTVYAVIRQVLAPANVGKRVMNKRSTIAALFPVPAFQNMSDIINEARASLLLWPLSQIDWPFQNLYRTDIQINYESPQIGNNETLKVLRPDERYAFRWTSDPFVASGYGEYGIGTGFQEVDTSYWLMVYYLSLIHI